jgi:hypothetical protein
MAQPTLELRWFFRGVAPAPVQKWYSDKLPGDRPQKEKVRQDLYFIVRDREDLGLKLSRGKLELKHRQEVQPFSLTQPRVAGITEFWIKEEWRYAKEFLKDVDLAFGKANLSGWRAEVHKNRSMRKYVVDARGNVDDLVKGEPAERLLKVELTNLTKHDRPWWTLCIEISGEPQNLLEIFALAVKNLLLEHPGLDLNTGHSYGYPHWLIHAL